MKYIYFLILGFFLFNVATANPGDTTIYQGHQNVQMTNTANYFYTFNFPNNNTKYRKIYFEYTLGKYACPAGTQYCASWDYIMNFSIKPLNTSVGSEELEMCRLVTPYATNSTYFPQTWNHTYIVDVTDYAPLLKDSVQMAAWFGGYSYGFTISTRFVFIEGTPAHEPLAVKQVYAMTSKRHGDSVSVLETYLNAKTLNIPSNTAENEFDFTITGHGSNSADGCGEFCGKGYNVVYNDTNIIKDTIWRMCGYDQIPAQTGTWIFDRAGWCPGEQVYTKKYRLGPSSGSAIKLDVNIEPYIIANSQANYNVSGNVFSFGAPAFTNAVEISEIINPSTINNYKPLNQNCVEVRLKVKNIGTNDATNFVVKYGFDGFSDVYYTWVGNLKYMEETTLTMPMPNYIVGVPDGAKFRAEIKQLNLQNNQDSFGNIRYSNYTRPATLPLQFIIRTKTNNTSVTSGGNFNETHWRLYNSAGAIVASRDSILNSVTVDDSLNLPRGCYKLVVQDDGYNDGLNFWYYQYYNQNPGTGFIRFISPSGSIIGDGITKFNSKYYGGDFGSGFEYSFIVHDGLSINDLNNELNDIKVYPNPATTLLNFELPDYLMDDKTIVYITDVQGKQIKSFELKHTNKYILNTADFNKGIYFVQFVQNGKSATKKVVVE